MPFVAYEKNLDIGFWRMVNDGAQFYSAFCDSDNVKRIHLDINFFGAIAQLGERLNGIQEVGGSIPPSSTILL